MSGMWVQLLAFVGVAVVVIVVPGPDTALTVRNALAGGRRGGVATAAGVATGQLVWAAAAGAGVAGLLAASEPLFRVVQLAGAAYLVFLGGQSILAAIRGTGHRPATPGTDGTTTPPVPPTPPTAPTRTAWRAWRQGVLSDLANPKMAVFFLALLPPFVPSGLPPVAGFVALGAVFCLLTFTWLALYAVLVDRARRWLARGRIRRALDAVSGCVLVAFGVRLATERVG